MDSLKTKDEEKKELALENTKSIILYALAFVVAMGANDLANSIFSRKEKKHLLGRAVYVVIVLIIALIAAYFFKVRVNTQF